MAKIETTKGTRGKTHRVRIRRKGVYESRTFLNKSDAERWQRKTESLVDTDEYWGRSASDTLTLAEALEKYNDEFTVRKAWPDVETARIRRLQKIPLAKTPLIKVQDSDIAAYIHERTITGKSNNTIRLELALLSQVFEQARLSWRMRRVNNPVKQVKRPKAPKGLDRRFEPGELERLCAHVPEDVATMIRLGIETALRRSELCRIVWRDVDLAGGWLNNVKGKDGLVESIPLSKRAIALFRSIPRVRADSTVFQRTADYITQRIHKSAKKANLVGIHMHVTRHEATSRLFERGLKISEVQSVTRHKTLAMLSRYNHARKIDAKAALDRTEQD